MPESTCPPTPHSLIITGPDIAHKYLEYDVLPDVGGGGEGGGEEPATYGKLVQFMD